ncbi:hypothetical protein ACKKBG_A25005 [Auxenochlorella protothecoides x Auxenochlorella symbiontica]
MGAWTTKLLVASILAFAGSCRAAESTLESISWGSEADGEPEEWGYRLFLTADNFTVSPWHSVPLNAGKDLHTFIVEIPKNTAAKYEVQTEEALNPIQQDLTSNGSLRYYHSDIPWNYGLLPQTWEDPDYINPDVNATGDNDPTDVVEIGGSALETGSIHPVKVLGAYALIDQGELDWKVIVISQADPLAERLNDIEDVERELPGELERIRVWFRDSKLLDGKPANTFGFDDQPVDRAQTLGVINQTHGFWLDLVSGARENTESKSVFG